MSSSTPEFCVRDATENDIPALIELRKLLLDVGDGHYVANTPEERLAWQHSYRSWLINNLSQNPKIKEKVRNTWYKNALKNNHSQNLYRRKKFTFPSGKQVSVQGYEPFALEKLLKKYLETDIFCEKYNVPKIRYIDSITNKKRLYFPDIFIPKDNLIIEIKSKYTYNKDYQNIKDKKNATLKEGFKFLVWIFNEGGSLIGLENKC